MSWDKFAKPDKIEDEHKCFGRPKVWVEREITDIVRFGSAIGGIIKVQGHWLADNGEYATAINYCPFCGIKLEEG